MHIADCNGVGGLVACVVNGCYGVLACRKGKGRAACRAVNGDRLKMAVRNGDRLITAVGLAVGDAADARRCGIGECDRVCRCQREVGEIFV